jgi:hypothetical protein
MVRTVNLLPADIDENTVKRRALFQKWPQRRFGNCTAGSATRVAYAPRTAPPAAGPPQGFET